MASYLRREHNSICFQTILASAFIPVFSGLTPPRYRGLRVIDGGFSDNLPVLDTSTITVSPLAGSAHICPQVHSLSDNTKHYIGPASASNPTNPIQQIQQIKLLGWL